MKRPQRLRPGQTAALISPAGATFERSNYQRAVARLEALGLKVLTAPHALDRRGHLAGRDEDRAADLNAMFADPSVDAIVTLRGGTGCGRILDRVDYAAAAAHPKPFIGFSDITSLLLALHARAGLVTFHGPSGISAWSAFTAASFKQVLFDAEAALLSSPSGAGDDLAPAGTRTLYPGKARGRLLGGNLAVLTSVLGGGYLPGWDGAILFLEEVNEYLYRIDRMFSQLRLAGVLDRLAGVVIGQFTRCRPGESFGTLTLEEILDDYLRPLGVPAFTGAQFGHVDDKLTLPVGAEVEIDADAGTIRLIGPAVV